jgi:hypothetical protein
MSIQVEQCLMHSAEFLSLSSLPETFQAFVQIVHLKTHPFCGLSSTQLDVDLRRFDTAMSCVLGDGVNIHATPSQVR